MIERTVGSKSVIPREDGTVVLSIGDVVGGDGKG
jgi:hypothetical protein